MKSLATTAFLLCIAASCRAQFSVDDLVWLEGTWRGTLKGGSIFETTYSSAEGGMILSISKRIQDGSAVFYEFECIEQEGGNVFLTPYPGGEKSARFTLVELDRERLRAKFENRSHDFPQEFLYEHTPEGRLRIVVAGEEKGEPRELVFHLERKQ